MSCSHILVQYHRMDNCCFCKECGQEFTSKNDKEERKECEWYCTRKQWRSCSNSCPCPCHSEQKEKPCDNMSNAQAFYEGYRSHIDDVISRCYKPPDPKEKCGCRPCQPEDLIDPPLNLSRCDCPCHSAYAQKHELEEKEWRKELLDAIEPQLTKNENVGLVSINKLRERFL